SLAQRLRLPVRAAQARTTHVVVLAQLGRTRSALRQAVLAETVLRDWELELARLRVNHGLVLQRIGRQAEALTRFGAAEPVLRRYGDVRWEVMLRNLRGTLLAYQGRSDLALADLTTGIELAGSVELETVLCSLHQNLGFALLRAGRVPEALKQIANARSLAASIGRRQDSNYADRADALLAAGLPV